MVTQILANFASGNELLPEGTKPLFEPTLTSHEILWHSPKDNYFTMTPSKNMRPDGLTSSAATLTLGPEIGPLGHIIKIHLSIPNEHVKQEWYKTISGPKMTWKLGLWGQYSTHVPLKVAQIDICNGKPVEFFFFKSPKTRISTYLGAQSDPKIGPLSPMFSTPLKVLNNEHVKQYWHETSENFWRKWPKTGILTQRLQNWASKTHIVHI